MAIRLKVAKTPEEIDDALWVRHEVFIVEDGKFGGKPAPDARMMDRFDALPDVYNIIAYDGDEPIATIRLTKENEIGLPCIVADDPISCVAHGTAIFLEHLDKYSSILESSDSMR